MIDDATADHPRAGAVLIVDDDLAVRELLKDVLGTEGYEVIEASSGLEAIDQVRRYRPSAVLMDLMMPIMSGAEATILIESQPTAAAIPVLAMSAGRNLTDVGLDVPADDFIPKPFDLIERIARHATRPIP